MTSAALDRPFAYRSRPTRGAAVLGVMGLLLAACGGDPGTPTPAGSAPLSRDAVARLLTVTEIEAVGADGGGLDVAVADRRADAEAVNQEQVRHIETWYAVTFHREEGSALFFSVIDFDSADAAMGHLETIEAGQGYSEVSPPVGDRSVIATPVESGLGSALVFVKADRVVALLTTSAAGAAALVEAQQLAELARIVESRL